MKLPLIVVNDSGFISVVYARTVYYHENFSFFSGGNFSYVLLDQPDLVMITNNLLQPNNNKNNVLYAFNATTTNNVLHGVTNAGNLL